MRLLLQLAFFLLLAFYLFTLMDNAGSWHAFDPQARRAQAWFLALFGAVVGVIAWVIWL